MQHGERDLADEDFARVLRGVHRPRHQLCLLQISSSSWPAPLDHPHSHRVLGKRPKEKKWFCHSFSSPHYFLNLFCQSRSLNLLGGDQLLQLARQSHHHHPEGKRTRFNQHWSSSINANQHINEDLISSNKHQSISTNQLLTFSLWKAHSGRFFDEKICRLRGYPRGLTPQFRFIKPWKVI